MVFDKTGTITTGELTLVGVRAEPGVDAASALLRWPPALGAASNHPVSRAAARAGAGGAACRARRRARGAAASA